MELDLQHLDEMFLSFLVAMHAYPLVGETVLQKMTVLRQTLMGTTVAELATARDATNSLVMIAREIGHQEMEQYFYELYEYVCSTLLWCYQGGLSS